MGEIFPFYDYYNLLPATVLLLAAGVLLFLLCRLVFRHTQLAGLIALAGLMALFPKVTLAVPVYLAIAGIGLLLPVFRVWRKEAKSLHDAIRLPSNFPYIANVAAAAMLAAIGLRAAYTVYVVHDQATAVADRAAASLPSPPVPAPGTDLPTIVHIVLDGYSRADVLREVYGFDNTPFLEALKQRGFRIADKATSPFNQTLFVMNAVFSLGASAAAPAKIVGEDPGRYRRMLARGTEHSGVAQILRGLGYEMQSTPSTYLPLQWSDVVDASGNSVSHLALPGTYALTYDLLTSSPALRKLSEALLGSSIGIESINYRYLKEVPTRSFRVPGHRPAFIYQHILAPHPPFNITAEGTRRQSGLEGGLADGSHLILGRDALRDRYREGYVEKLRYINAAILKQIDSLKKSLPGPLVIVLHGDHGGGLHFDHDTAANTCFHERYSPLLAVFATDERITAAITNDFDLVNLYRVILGKILGAELPPLARDSTYVSWQIDNAVRLHSAELASSCGTPRKTWTAERPSPEFAPAPNQTPSPFPGR